jgi:hypothetical protein
MAKIKITFNEQQKNLFALHQVRRKGSCMSNPEPRHIGKCGWSATKRVRKKCVPMDASNLEIYKLIVRIDF